MQQCKKSHVLPPNDRIFSFLSARPAQKSRMKSASTEHTISIRKPKKEEKRITTDKDISVNAFPLPDEDHEKQHSADRKTNLTATAFAATIVKKQNKGKQEPKREDDDIFSEFANNIIGFNTYTLHFIHTSSSTRPHTHFIHTSYTLHTHFIHTSYTLHTHIHVHAHTYIYIYACT